MSIAGVILNKVLWLLRLISTCGRRLVECIRFGRAGAPRIGELPYVRVKEERQPFINGQNGQGASPPPQHHQASPFQQSHPHEQQNNSWNTWDDRTFGIETKIAEYRQQMQQQKHPVNAAQQHPSQGVPAQNPPDDLFSDLQPKLKAAKTYRLHDPIAAAATQAPRQSLFEVKEMDPFANRVGFVV